MAGKSAARAPELDGNRESTIFDNILRRLESSSDQEAASNSMEAFDASVLSPNNFANPWQYLSTSNPPSPSLQRDLYNLTHSLDASENPWTELEQQRVPMLQADDVGQKGGARGTLLQRRREQRNLANDSTSEVPGAHGQSDAMLYEELAAAWYRSGYLRGSSVSPRDEGLQGMWEGLIQAYASEERLGNSSGHQNADSASVNQQFDPNMKSFGLTDTSDEARWQRPMPSLDVGGQFVESSTSEAADMDTRTAPSFPVGENWTRSSSDCRVSPNTSLSSGSGGDDSDDEECARNVDQPSVLDSGGKRKTPAASEELEGKDESARTSSEIMELKKTAPSEITNRPRKKKNTKRLREPRYAIKTRTDVDIMDDGFKWRKYGQKAVKNSPHPRNYYRCTTPQCPVRKRVERASEDAGLVITTYEGTHTHHSPNSIPHSHAPERPPHTRPLPPGLGLGFGLRSSNLLPLPPEFTTLAALHQMRSLQQILAHQQLHMPTVPRSLQHESLLRAQQFLGLHESEVKPQPFHHNFLENQLMGRQGFPYRPNLLRPQQQRNPPLDPQADADLVRRVLEADEFGGNADFREENVDSSRISTPPGDFVSQIQSGLRNQVAMEARRRAALLQRAVAVPRGSVTSSRSRGGGTGEGLPRGSVTVSRSWGGGTGEGLPRRPAPRPTEDELVDGLLQEMAKRGESSASR